MRLGYSSTCGFLSLLFSAIPWAAWGQETTEPGLPTWRVQAGLFGSSPGQSLGVYHRLGEQWDWGLEVGTNFTESESDRDRLDTFSDGSFSEGGSSRESDNISFRLNADLRHWGQIREKLNWFLGPRLGGGYGNNSDTFRSQDSFEQSQVSISEFETQSYSARVGFTIGVDLELLKGLSTTVAFLPASFEYHWSDRDEKSLDIRDGIVERTRESDEDQEDFIVETDFLPRLYLTLTID